MEEKENIKRKTKKKKEEETKRSRKKKNADIVVEKELDLEQELSRNEANEKQEPEVKEVIVERKSGFNLLEVVVIMLITLFFGGLLGSAITYANQKGEIGTTKVPKDLKELVDTYHNLLENYYEDVDKEKLLDAGIKGMIDYLGDDYSNYMNQEETSDFNQQVKGRYVGIGVEILRQEDGSVLATKVFEGSPAAKVGMKAGDVFLKVGGQSVDQLSTTQISSLIKGESGTNVKLTIRQGEEEKEVVITREEVEITSVFSAIFPVEGKKVGFLRITVFAENTDEQFEKALLDLEKQGIDSLIIDVRNNSGGYLETVETMLSLFMGKSSVLYQLDTKGIVESVHAKTNEKRNYPVAVLINKTSASASEILAAAMMESYGADVVGVNSYGKGTVQRAYELDSGATIKFTIQKWLTPKGNWINEVGVTPTKEVVLDDAYHQNPSDETDNQLQAAIELLSQK